MQVPRRFGLAFRLLCLSSLCLLSSSGCLASWERVLLRYDERADRFTILNLHEHFSTERPLDINYLYNRWRNREHIIPMPMPALYTMGSLKGSMALVRMGPEQFAWIWGECPGALEEEKSPVRLDEIRILPGRFFVTKREGVCYYEQVEVPGKTVDQLLSIMMRQKASAVSDAIHNEQLRRRNGGRRMTWQGVHDHLLERIRQVGVAKEPVTQGDETKSQVPIDPLQCVDDESLQMIEKGVTDGRLSLTRQKQSLRLSIPMSAADRRQLLNWMQTLRHDAGVLEQASHAKESQSFTDQLALALFVLLEVQSRDDGTVLFTVDLVKAYAEFDRIGNTLLAQQEQELPAKAAQQPQGRPEFSLQAALRRRGIVVDEKTAVEEIIQAFERGSLQVFPSDKTVAPGDGLADCSPLPTDEDLAQIKVGETTEADLTSMLGTPDKKPGPFRAEDPPIVENPTSLRWTFKNAGILLVQFDGGTVSRWTLDHQKPGAPVRPGE